MERFTPYILSKQSRKRCIKSYRLTSLSDLRLATSDACSRRTPAFCGTTDFLLAPHQKSLM